MISISVSRGTQRALGDMRRLAGLAGKMYRQRLKHASRALHDAAWVRAKFSGDAVAATQFLQDNYFADLSGYITLRKLLEIYRDVPDEVWRQYHYNLRAIELLHDRPELADPDSQHVAVRAHVRFPDGTRHETVTQERTRLLEALRRLDVRRRRLVSRLRQLGVTVQ